MHFLPPQLKHLKEERVAKLLAEEMARKEREC